MHRQKAHSFLVAILALVYGQLWAPIIELKKFADSMDHVHTILPDGLVVYDIDNTLIEPQDELQGSDQWRAHYENHLKDQDPENFLERAYAEYYERQFKNTVCEVEPGIAQYVHSIRALNIPVLAITNRSAVLKTRTVEQLASVTIDFDNGVKDFEFQARDASGQTYTVTHHKGIMHTRGFGKGKALGYYCKHTGNKPKHVLMVDDSNHNLDDMEKYCAENDIKFIGLHYTFLAEKVKSFSARHK